MQCWRLFITRDHDALYGSNQPGVLLNAGVVRTIDPSSNNKSTELTNNNDELHGVLDPLLLIIGDRTKELGSGSIVGGAAASAAVAVAARDERQVRSYLPVRHARCSSQYIRALERSSIEL